MPEDEAKIIKKGLELFQRSPAAFFKEAVGVPLWSGQLQILSGIASHKKVVVGSGHALGKDYIAGFIAIWFLYFFGPCKVVLTAPSERQVKSIMWAELTRHYNSLKVEKLGDMKSLRLTINEGWFVEGFTTKEANQQQGKFQGYHAPNVLVIVSEAQAVDNIIYDQIEGLMTSENSRLLLIGNPITTSGRYIQELNNTTDNHVIHLSCLDNPNYIERKEVIPGLASFDWVEDKRKRWGEGDPRWVGRVLGRVPTSSVDTVIPSDLYDRAVNKQLLTWDKKKGTIGVDPARYGDDDMVITVMESGKLLEEVIRPRCSAPEGCSLIAQLQKKWFPEGQIAIVVDCDGLGGPYLDFLKEMIPDELNIQYVEFHGSSTDREKVGAEYFNHRAEAAFYAKEMMEKGMISLDSNETAKEEAITERYFINLKGKIQIEDKEDIKERLGRSPGQWDARKMAIWGFKFAQVIHKKDSWRSRRSAGFKPDVNSFMTA